MGRCEISSPWCSWRSPAYHDQGDRASKDLPRRQGPGEFSRALGRSSSGNENLLLCLGASAKPRPRSFGASIRSGRREYLAFVEAGVEQGRREDLTKGGLIRSLGGWSAVKRLWSMTRDHLKSDERILGDSEFVDSILARAEEKITRQSELRRRGYDLDRIAERVSEIYAIDGEEILAWSRRERGVQARSLYCSWAVRELRISLTDLARRLGMSLAGVGYAVQRREVIARERSYQLTP